MKQFTLRLVAASLKSPLLVLEGDYARADAAFQAAEDPETRVTQFRNRARALGEVEAVAFAAGQAYCSVPQNGPQGSGCS